MSLYVERVVLDRMMIKRTLARMSYELVERNKGATGLALVGIQRRGVYMARRIAAQIEKIDGAGVPVGVLDITLYRDDLTLVANLPVVHNTAVDFSVDERTIILVDDVLFTGRTVRCALAELCDLGRAKSIQLAVLVDRGHRELPIHADYVGHQISTTLTQSVEVRLKELDGVDEVVVLSRRRARR